MNGEEGPTLGRPQLPELGQHFPLEGYRCEGHPGLSLTINTTLPKGITWAPLPLPAPFPGWADPFSGARCSF